MKNFDTLVNIWGNITIISFIVGLLGAFCIYQGKRLNEYSKTYIRLGIILLAQMVLCVFLLFVISSIFRHIVRTNFKNDLKSEIINLKINNFTIDSIDKVQFISELMKVRSIYTNHSGPQEIIKIKILTSSKIINIELKRDSKDSNLYWVFINDYKTTSLNEIGLVRTNLLNKY